MSPTVKDRIKLLLNDARSLSRDLKWADAERRYIEALGIDPHCWDAYKGLGQIYLKQDLLPQAKETFNFLLKSNKADDVCFAALADIAEEERDLVLAEDMRRKAVEFRPRLANRHAELAEFYVKQGFPDKAWPSAKRAAELDSKSAKYLEISLETAILLGERNEARKRYDKLRVLSQDRPKLQALKERIDEMPGPQAA
jgi:tetratricopeptide (TPR) repeat protein